VGHRRQDFDTSTHLSGIRLYVTYVPFYLSAFYPMAPFAIQMQAIQDREAWFVIRVGFHLQNALGSHVDAHFLNHGVNQVLRLLFFSPFTTLAQVCQCSNAEIGF
jgi:hypothetical protein